MFRLLRWIITTLTALCLLYLITMNPQTITLSWYPGADPLELPIAALIIILFAVGYIIGTLYYAFPLWPKQLKTAKKIRAQDTRQITPVTGGIKLGLEFFNRFGPQGIEAVMESAPEASYFIDLKFHDIPNTVAGAVRSICENLAPAYLNVHASGGQAMMEAAKAACGANTKLLAVTILTSLDNADMDAIGYQGSTDEQVKQLATLTQTAGLDGVVCSAHDIENLRAACGDDFALMVPGIRPAGAETGDQKRIMTPQEALSKGATHLVIGRPITGADDASKAAQEIVESL